MTTIPKNTQQIIFEETLSSKRIILEENANLLYILLLQKGNAETHEINIDLRGHGSRVDVIGLFLGSKKEKFNLKMQTNFIGANTYGHTYLKSLLKDESEVNFDGMLNIEAGANGSDSYLAHHTLLLSKESRTRSIPGLEIKANDIKAGHSATMGQMDDETVFYLMSRGLPEAEAKRMLTDAFLEEFFLHIPDEKTRKQVHEKMFIKI